jgi:hypothetical protein
MRAREFIIPLNEAKPENLGQGMLDKLFATYEKRDTREFKFSTGLEVANELFKYVGQPYLAWAAKQYNIDPHFFLHDLPQWKNDLTAFAQVSKDRRVQINKDINSYKNIDELRKVVEKASGSQESLGSKFYSTAIAAIDEFVKKGSATWLYRGDDYSIYHPKTFESSNLCSKLMSTNVCTIMNQNHFNDYSDNGTLMYIIGQDKLYNCFISKDPDEMSSEFSDQKNDHSYDLKWMLKHFPELKPWVVREMSEDDWAIVFQMNENPSQELQLAAVEQNGYAIYYIKNPSEAVQLAAVKQNGGAIYNIKNPSEAVQLAAVKQNGRAIEYIKNPSEAVQLAAVEQDGGAIYHIKNPSEAVQLAAVKQNGLAIYNIKNPSEAVQLAAVQNNGDAIRYIKNPSDRVIARARGN